MTFAVAFWITLMIPSFMRWATKPAGHWRRIPSLCGPALLLLLGGVSPLPKVTTAAQIPTSVFPTPVFPTSRVPPQDPETLRRNLAEEPGLYSAEISPIDNRATGPPEYFERGFIEEEAIEGGVLGNELSRESWFKEQIGYDIPRVYARKKWLYGDSIVDAPPTDQNGFWWQAVGKAYYLNDQRWEFTGQEATFGVEGILLGGMVRQHGDWRLSLGGEFYINQPFDPNILVDVRVRREYQANYQIDPLEISQLALSAKNGDLTLTLGKFTTPFGRTYFPLLSNARWDAPFIRSEAILFRETGWMMDWSPGPWEITLALTNGSEDQDTNSSKALITRFGWSSEAFTLGVSLKEQDGIGSESQKYYNSHVGFDMAYRAGRWTLCSEILFDKYGFRRGTFPQRDIYWERSLYHRDLHFQNLKPITGTGFYLGGLYEGKHWTHWLSYGQFFPQALGDPIHDAHTRRFIAKCIRNLTPNFQAYSVLLLENSLDVAQDGHPRHGVALNLGFQASF